MRRGDTSAGRNGERITTQISLLQQSRRAEEPREREREREVNIRGEQRGKTSPTNKKTKTKYVDLGCVVCSRKLLKIMAGSILATAIIIGLVVMIVEFVPHHHSHALHPDNYTLALHKTLLFFNAQKCKNLHISHRILHDDPRIGAQTNA